MSEKMVRGQMVEGPGRKQALPDPACESCLWWKPIQASDGEFGYCRRHAPQPVLANVEHGRELEVIWPMVAAWEFCGDYRHPLAMVGSSFTCGHCGTVTHA